MDLAAAYDAALLAADLRLEGADLQGDEGLATAVVLSLFTDRRALESDPHGGDPRGWWGDAAPAAPGDRIGSRLWLLAREKETPAALRRAEEYAREALQWLLDDGVAARVEVVGSIPRPGVLGLEVTLTRPAGDVATLRFDSLWRST